NGSSSAHGEIDAGQMRRNPSPRSATSRVGVFSDSSGSAFDTMALNLARMRSRPRSSKPPDPATSTATIVWYVGLYAAAVPKPPTADGTIASGASGRNSRDPLPGTGPTPYDRDISACDGHTRWPAADWAECKRLTGPGRRHGLGRIRGTVVMEPPNGDRVAAT